MNCSSQAKNLKHFRLPFVVVWLQSNTYMANPSNGRGAAIVNARRSPEERAEASRNAVRKRWNKATKAQRLEVGRQIRAAKAAVRAARAAKLDEGVAE